jgi:hypothetical protein
MVFFICHNVHSAQQVLTWVSSWFILMWFFYISHNVHSARQVLTWVSSWFILIWFFYISHNVHTARQVLTWVSSWGTVIMNKFVIPWYFWGLIVCDTCKKETLWETLHINRWTFCTHKTLVHVVLHTMSGQWQPNLKTYVDRASVTDHHMFPNLPLNQDESIDKFTYLCHPQITDIISKNFWSSHSNCTNVL